MAILWEYSGLVNIERATGNIGEAMQLPVCFQSPADSQLLSPEEIEREARALAEAFLDMLTSSDPKHRQDYGNIVSIDITSIVQTGD